MTQLFTNNASGTLSVQAEIIDTILTLQVNEGQLFPAPTGGDFFRVTLEDTSGNVEIVECTGKSSDDLTVIRARESTSAKIFPTGSKVEIRPTSGTQDSFLQVFGGVMQGELDMNNEQLTDPLVLGGEIRNSPLRGTDGGTANEIVVPTAAGAPTLGGNNIIHTGNDGAYALIATTVTANLPITESSGDLGSNLVFDFTPVGLDPLQGNALANDDEIVVWDASASANKSIKYEEAGLPVVVGSGSESITNSMANTFRTYSAVATVTFDTGDLEIGAFIMFQQLHASNQVTLAGSTLRAANGLKTAKQYSVICALKITATEFAIFGDTVV